MIPQPSTNASHIYFYTLQVGIAKGVGEKSPDSSRQKSPDTGRETKHLKMADPRIPSDVIVAESRTSPGKSVCIFYKHRARWEV